MQFSRGENQARRQGTGAAATCDDPGSIWRARPSATEQSRSRRWPRRSHVLRSAVSALRQEERRAVSPLCVFFSCFVSRCDGVSSPRNPRAFGARVYTVRDDSSRRKTNSVTGTASIAGVRSTVVRGRHRDENHTGCVPLSPRARGERPSERADETKKSAYVRRARARACVYVCVYVCV